MYQLAYALHNAVGDFLINAARQLGCFVPYYTIDETDRPATSKLPSVFPFKMHCVVILPGKPHDANAHNQLREIDSWHNTNLTKFNRHHCSTVTSSSWMPLLLKGALGYT